MSVRNMMHTNWLPSRAISFSYRPASFGGKTICSIQYAILNIQNTIYKIQYSTDYRI